MPVVNGYCTVEELREQFKDATDETAKLPLPLLERAISATSRGIDDFTGRRFWRDPTDALTTRRYRCDDGYEVDVRDVSTATGLIVAADTNGDGTFATTWAASDYQLEPLDVDADGGAYAWTRIVAVGDRTFPTTGRRPGLRVTARHGWSAIPDDVNQACILRAASIFKRREATFGVAGFDQMGAVVRITRKDPDVIDLLHNFIRIQVRAV